VRSFQRFTIAIALLVSARIDASGQAPYFGPGAQVRTTIVGVQRTFILVEQLRDSIVVRDKSGGEPMRLAYADLDALDVSSSSRDTGQRFFGGLLKGAVIAGGIGAALVGFAAAAEGEALSWAAFGFVVFAPFGAVIGGIVGLSGDGQTWVPLPAITDSTPPSLVLGVFQDDYDGSHAVTPTMWAQGASARYHITRWVPMQQYLIARNDSANASDGGKWTRIDWMPLTGMPPYEWAFCFSAYNAPTAAAAESTMVANRDTPRTGCNGFPFSRMRRR
jgi:hypothetical protein